MRRKKSELDHPKLGGIKSNHSFESRASASSLALSHWAIWRVEGDEDGFSVSPIRDWQGFMCLGVDSYGNEALLRM